MSEYVVTDTELTAVADAIRTKGGTSADLEWNADFISAIEAISGGGSDGSFVNPKHIDVNIDSMFNSILTNYPQFNGFTALGGSEKRNWWGANNASQHWLSVTFEEAECIDKIEFSNAFKEGTSQWQSTEVIFQGSNDNSNWTDLLTLTNLTPSETPEIYNVNNNDKYLHYRFLCTSGGTFYTGLGKIRLYGKGEGGGGAKNILKGTDAPTASIGRDGDIYLQHSIPSDYRTVEFLTTHSSTLTYAQIPMLVKAGDVYEYSASRESWTSDYYVLFGVKTSITQTEGDRIANGLYTNKKRIFAGTGRIHATEDPTKTAGQSVVYGDTITSGKFAQSITVDSFSNAKYYLFYGGYASNSVSPSTNIGRATLKRSNGNPFIDLIPCVRKSDSVCGFYDTVSDTFYTAVSGSFTAPNETFVYDDVVRTYCKVNGAWQALEGTDIDDVNTEGDSSDNWIALKNYIESSGTQYIDTGYVANDNTKVELIANVNTVLSQYASLFGARNGNYNTATKTFIAYRENTYMTCYVGGGTTKGSIAMSQYLGSKSKWTLSKESFGVENSDGINFTGIGINGGTVDNENNMYLLSFNENGVDLGTSVRCSAKVYRFRIYENDTLVHEFIPWQENGVACLKDTVTGNIKYNAGTGDFTFGTDS